MIQNLNNSNTNTTTVFNHNILYIKKNREPRERNPLSHYIFIFKSNLFYALRKYVSLLIFPPTSKL
jgi:hypothetical protein